MKNQAQAKAKEAKDMLELVLSGEQLRETLRTQSREQQHRGGQNEDRRSKDCSRPLLVGWSTSTVPRLISHCGLRSLRIKIIASTKRRYAVLGRKHRRS